MSVATRPYPAPIAHSAALRLGGGIAARLMPSAKPHGPWHRRLATSTNPRIDFVFVDGAARYHAAHRVLMARAALAHPIESVSGRCPACHPFACHPLACNASRQRTPAWHLRPRQGGGHICGSALVQVSLLVRGRPPPLWLGQSNRPVRAIALIPSIQIIVL